MTGGRFRFHAERIASMAGSLPNRLLEDAFGPFLVAHPVNDPRR